ncbi:hypothetical protein ACUXHY_004847 [Cytobacillus horneckiae]|nr:hypothetical protein [Cytobacillus horneckiae]
MHKRLLGGSIFQTYELDERLKKVASLYQEVLASLIHYLLRDGEIVF